MASASRASMSRAVKTSSLTRPKPTRAASRARFEAEKQLPSVRATGTPNRADGAATRRSHAAAIARPPPTTGPRSAATVGTVTSSIAPSHASIRRSYATACSAVLKSANCAMSVPATNASFAPVSTTARTVRSAFASRQIAAIRSYIANVIAFRAERRSTVIQSAPPRRSVRISPLTIVNPATPRPRARAARCRRRCSRPRGGPPPCARRGAARYADAGPGCVRGAAASRARGWRRGAGAADP